MRNVTFFAIKVWPTFEKDNARVTLMTDMSSCIANMKGLRNNTPFISHRVKDTNVAILT